MNFDVSTRVGKDEKLATEGVDLLTGQRKIRKETRGAPELLDKNRVWGGVHTLVKI